MELAKELLRSYTADGAHLKNKELGILFRQLNEWLYAACFSRSCFLSLIFGWVIGVCEVKWSNLITLLKHSSTLNYLNQKFKNILKKSQNDKAWSHVYQLELYFFLVLQLLLFLNFKYLGIKMKAINLLKKVTKRWLLRRLLSIVERALAS